VERFNAKNRIETLDETASLRAQVRALRLALSNVPNTLIGLYSPEGTCKLLVGTKKPQHHGVRRHALHGILA
jgi:hypothetical protein